MPRFSPIVKIIILGDANVGKTCLLTRYVTNRYLANYKSTIGVDFLTKDVIIDGRNVIAQIWDTAGQERFHSLGNAFYRGADALMLVYDVTDRRTFNNLQNWYQDVVAITTHSKSLPVAIVGNKIDTPDTSKQVSTSVARTWLHQHPDHALYETSAKDDLGVTAVFQHLLQLAMKQMNTVEVESDFPSDPKPVIQNVEATQKCSC